MYIEVTQESFLDGNVKRLTLRTGKDMVSVSIFKKTGRYSSKSRLGGVFKKNH